VLRPRIPRSPARHPERATLVTGAASPASTELNRRQLRYGITMAIRVGCFLAVFIVPGPMRWVLLGAAVVLPYVAVILASQVDSRDRRGSPESPWTGPGVPRSAIGIGAPGRPDDTQDGDGVVIGGMLEHPPEEEQR
jgi:hypothetical protein